MQKSICLIIPYFGRWPDWFSFYLKSCGYNRSVNWMIFTNCRIPDERPDNVRFVNMSLGSFNRLASEKLRIKINIEKPYKVCDLRPAFGLIFEDFISDYNFWGNTDIDIIYGNIRDFITDDILEKFDVITSYKNHLCGHFTIYKNNKKINNLFKLSNCWKEIFKNEKYVGFDEINYFEEVPKNDTRKYRSINDVVNTESDKKNIKYFHRTIHRSGDNPLAIMKLSFKDGHLTDLGSKKEIMYFHFGWLKNKNQLLLPYFQPGNGNFFITSIEIFYTKKNSMRNLSIYVKRASRIIYSEVYAKFHMAFGIIGSVLKEKIPKIYYFLKK